ncbi:MAG: hypothetical protein J3K34DRAFT_487111 [Monoraphidium minutum]|nr:MAG: hypothetical protein J3K34DRAFT_487111 [Monoraphidium minutum]
MSKPADERIRVSVRLRPVSKEESDAHPPPWPVQAAEGEIRIHSCRTPRGGPVSKLVAASSAGSSVQLSPRLSASPQGAAALKPAGSAALAGLAEREPSAARLARPASAQPPASLVGADYQSYPFAEVFGPAVGSDEVYERSGARDIVEGACQGCNGTVFLYGQTGSGKTFTHDAVTRAAVATIFGAGLEDSGRELAAVALSVVEIYCEGIRCLLTGRAVTLRHAQRGGGVLLEGAGEQACVSEEAMLSAISAANARRSVGETRANARSSRSHLVVRVRLEVLELAASGSPTGGPARGGPAGRGASGGGGGVAAGVAFGVLNLVDLAGSERIEKSGSAESKALLREALNINRSLLALGNVVNALAERGEGKRVHVPYRESKLTRLLEDALGGSARTALIACATPLPGFHAEQTRATLEFAARAAHVVCSPRRNVVELEAPGGGDAGAAALAAEVEALRAALAVQTAECDALRARLGAGGAGGGGEDDGSPLERLKRMSLKRGVSGALRSHALGALSWGGASGPGSLPAAGCGGGGAGGGAGAGGRASRAGRRSSAAAAGGGGEGAPPNAAAAARSTCPGVAPSSALIWRLLLPNRAPQGLSSLIPPQGADAGGGDGGGALPPRSSAAAVGGGGAPQGGAAPRGLRKWSTLSGHEAGGPLRRGLSGGAPELSSLGVVRRDSVCGIGSALQTGGSATGRRVTDSECGAGAGAGAADRGAGAAAAAAAARDAGLREHIIRQLVSLLQQKKAEARGLRKQVAALGAQLAAAAEEGAAKEARLQQMVGGIARLGAARREEFDRWAASLAGLESAAAAAQQEAAARRGEAAALQAQLAAAGARCSAQAEQLRRTSLVVVQTGHALADAKTKGAASLATCMAHLAGIRAAAEALLARAEGGPAAVAAAAAAAAVQQQGGQQQAQPPELTAAAGMTAAEAGAQLALLRGLLPAVRGLLDQHREQLGLEARQAAALGGAAASLQWGDGGSGCGSGASSARGSGAGGCAKCETTKPLLAFMAKLKEDVVALRATVADRDAQLASSAEAMQALRGDLAEARASAAELQDRAPPPRRAGAGAALRALEALASLGCGDGEEGADKGLASPGGHGLGRAGSACGGGEGLMGPDTPLEQLHFQILKSWAELRVPHALRAAAAAHPSWSSPSACQGHVALLACLHQLWEEEPERGVAAAAAMAEEEALLAAGIAALGKRELAAVCRGCGVPDSRPAEQRAALLARLWAVAGPADAGAAAAGGAAAVAAALRGGRAPAVVDAALRGAGHFFAAAGAALRDAAVA